MPSRRQKRLPVRIGHRSEGRPIRRGLRWERSTGISTLAVVVAIAFFYGPPLHGVYEQRKQTSEARAHLQAVAKENRELKSLAKSLRRSSTIELEARKLGMVLPEERPFVVIR